MRKIAHQAFALVAAVTLHDDKFDETPQQTSERQKLVAEILAAHEVGQQWPQNKPTLAQKKAVAQVWRQYADKARRELLIRKVDIRPLEQVVKGKQAR